MGHNPAAKVMFNRCYDKHSSLACSTVDNAVLFRKPLIPDVLSRAIRERVAEQA